MSESRAASPLPLPLLQRVRFVLVRPRGALNVGLAARALRTMGIGRLDLVAPRAYRERVARRMCSRAGELLDRLVVHPDLPTALGHAVLVAAATARPGQERGPFLAPAELARLFARAPGDGELVVVCGPEDHGLSADDLQHCPLRVTIPADPGYPALNLALAVQVLAYELRLAALEARAGAATGAAEAAEMTGAAGAAGDEERGTAAGRELLEGLYGQLGQVLERIGFLNPQNPGHIQRSFRRIFDRAGLDAREVGILRGMLSNVQRLLG